MRRLSKAERLARIHKNLAMKSDNYRDADENLAYAVWLAEKEFNVGPITRDFPVMKLWNLFRSSNLDKNRIANERAMKKSQTSIKTFR